MPKKVPAKPKTTNRTKAKSTRKATPRAKNPGTLRASKKARLIIELMLKEMREGMKDPSHLTSDEWERLFGTKQSMVANLQKLVQALAALPEDEMEAQVSKSEALPPMTREEVQIIKGWLMQEGQQQP